MGNTQKAPTRILVVDDIESNRFILKDIIINMGFQPLLAENGKQALKIVDRFFPQLIISDIAMPEMDGIELCQSLKNDPRTRNIPIIFISAFDDANDVIKGIEAGGVDYIVKPFHPEIVRARVTSQLKYYEAQRELSETNRLLQKSIQEQLRMLEIEKRNVLYALVRMGRENAAYDDDHMKRLCFNCRMLAEALQLTNEYGSIISDGFVETIELVASLCELGNVGIPAEILQKTDQLTEDEKKLVLKHTIIGSQIIKDVQGVGEYNEFLQMSYDIARYHHEYYGGGGYPEGIAGDKIPLSAQIVAVVSSYCALTEDRSYRKAFEPEKAIEIISEDSSTKYNPQMCKVLKMIYRQLK